MGERLVGIDYPRWLSFGNSEQISRERIVQAIRAAWDWHRKYSCNRPVNILPFENVTTIPPGRWISLTLFTVIQ